jgi:CheY-like chemotaxis protein
MPDTNIPKETLIILLVEDSSGDAHLVMQNLSDHPVPKRIFHVSTGEEALDYLYRRENYADPADSPRPHLILLDLNLPKMNGLQVLKIIKYDESLRSIPVAVVTGSPLETDIARAYECHANSYLIKPVDFNKFTRLVDELSYDWLAHDHIPWS